MMDILDSRVLREATSSTFFKSKQFVSYLQMLMLVSLTAVLLFARQTALATDAIFYDPTSRPVNFTSTNLVNLSQPTALDLKMIFYTPQAQVAIINSQAYEKSMHIDQYQIARITNSRLHLTAGQNNQQLNLFPKVINNVR